MQTIYAFSYTPAIATGTNSTNTVWRMAYQQPIMLYKGTANTIKIVVFNSKQKVVDLTEYDVQIQIVDRETQEHFITKTGTIASPTSGVATITFTESDLRGLDNRFYHIIARLTDPADESSIVGNEILYLDDNYGAFTPVTIENAWNFNPSNLPVSGTADLNLGNIIPLLNNTYYLGNVDYRWHSLYTGNVKVGNITINGSSISTAPSSANNLILTANRHSMTFSDVSVGTQGIGATLRFDDIENSPGPRFETWYGNVATPTDPPGQHSLDIYTSDVNSYVEFGSYDENTFMGIDSLGAFVYTNWNSDKGQRWNFDSEGFFSLPNNGVIVNNTTNVAVLFNENNLTIRTQDPDGSTQHLSSFNETGGMTIDGDTIPLGNNLHDLGASANQWKQVHVSDAIVLNGAFLRINESNQPTVNGTPIISLINSLTHNDDITITTNNIDSSSYVWTFDLNGNLDTPGGIQVAGILKIDDGVHEKFQTKADATGTVTHDCSLGHIFFHTSPDANWTANFTNLNLSSNYATSVTLVIAQGGTGYYPNVVQIGGAAQTINWQGNVNPTVSTNRTDVVTFSIINNSGTYTVLGQLTGF